jgi:predicted ATPase
MDQANSHLQRVKIEGFKWTNHPGLAMRHINTFIGANGTDKTNFISRFTLWC